MKIEFDKEESWNLMSHIVTRLLEEAPLADADKAKIRRWKTEEMRLTSQETQVLTDKLNEDVRKTMERKTHSQHPASGLGDANRLTSFATMDSFQHLVYEKQAGVAWLTLNRPQVLNAINLDLRDELWSVLDAVELDPDVAVVGFRGAGERAFSAGADISDFGTAPSFVEARRGRLERDIWGRLAAFEKPLLAAVHGYALGAGCELSLLCDLRIASEDAVFGLPEVSLGYIPTAGGSQTLPRTIGPGRALDMILTGERINAAQALDCGLVQWVVPRDQLFDYAQDIAQRLAGQPAAALRAARTALNRGMDLSLTEGLRLEARLGARLALV